VIVAPELQPHGIRNEDSYIRAHVSPTARKILVFRTADMLANINQNNYRTASAGQNGVLGITARGYLVPWRGLPFIRCIESKKPWWNNFADSQPEGQKGKRAVDVVVMAMTAGKFPFWVEPHIVTDVNIDIKGTDLTVEGTWRIQVKCDFNAGITGNLFIQFEECNPMKRY